MGRTRRGGARAGTVVAGRGAAGQAPEGFEVSRPAAWVRWLPPVLAVSVVALELALPTQFTFAFLLVGLPGLAACTLGPGAVLAVTAGALGLQLVLAAPFGHLAEHHHLSLYVATAVVGVLSAVLASHRRRQDRSLVKAGSVAEALMRALLQPVPDQVGGVLAAGLYRAAEAGTLVGGDLYDIRATGVGVRAVVGDVRGKGLRAVRTVAAVLGSFREAALDRVGLEEVAARLERRLEDEARAAGDDELFVTAVLVEYDALAQRVTVLNLGHVEPVLISGGEVRTLTGPPALPLGTAPLADVPPAPRTHRFAEGDLLLLCTDGLVEARDRNGAFYPLLERLRSRFDGRGAPTPAEVVDFLNTDLPGHCRSLQDDVAILALAPHGPSRAEHVQNPTGRTS